MSTTPRHATYTPASSSSRRPRMLFSLLLLLTFVAGTAFAGSLGSIARRSARGAALASPAAPAQATPNPAGSVQDARVWLPNLNHHGDDDVCDSWINVLNLGAESAQAVLVTFHRGPGLIDCTAAAGVECTGLIAPGGAWALFGAQVPVGSASGVLLSASTRPFRGIDPSAETDDLISTWFCARVAAAMSGDCDAFDLLDAEWRTGGTLFGMPFDGLFGMPLAASVYRVCPGPFTPGITVTSAYAGQADADLGVAVDSGEWQAVAPSVHAEAAGATSMVYIQNAGTADSAPVVELSRDGLVVVTCSVAALAPGRSAAFDVRACAAAGFHGAARVRADQPMAVVVETDEGDTTMAYAAAAARLGPGDSAAARPLPDRTAGHAPHIAGGPDASITVRLERPGGEAEPAAVWNVRLRDASGAIVQESPVTVVSGTPRMVSFPYGALAGPGSLDVVPVQAGQGEIVGVVEQRERRGATSNILVAAQASPLAHRASSADNATLALPMAAADMVSSGLGGELSVTNLVEADGMVEAAVYFDDGHGIVDVACAVLGPRQTTTFDLLMRPGLLYSGFRGSAFVSATSWTHAGAPALAAEVTMRKGGPSTEDIPGDEVASVVAVQVPDAGGQAPEVRAVMDPCTPDVGPLRPLAPPRVPGGALAPAMRTTGAMLALPLLVNFGQDALCTATLTVHNAGSEASRVVLVAFGEPGFCPPGCAGPLRVECLGTLAPGETRAMSTLSGEGPAPLFSGLALSVSTRRLSELGIVLPGVEGDPPVADVVCDWLAGIANNCEAFSAFRAALAQGGSWRGIPLGSALGPMLTAYVARECPLDVGGPSPVGPAGGYAAPSVAAASAPFPAGGPYAYGVPVAYSAAVVMGPGTTTMDATTLITLQNLGESCATVMFWLRAAGECAQITSCNIATLAPGESYPFDLTECADLEWTGSVTLRSTMPLAVVAEHLVDEAGTYAIQAVVARPGFDPFDVDLDGLVTAADVARVAAAIGRTASDPGWDDRDDLDADGEVTEADRALVAAHLCRDAESPTPTPTLGGSSTATPDPGTSATPTAGTPTATDPSGTGTPTATEAAGTSTPTPPDGPVTSTPTVRPPIHTPTGTPTVARKIYLPFAER